jgi:small GTP-binding protein
MSDKKDDDFNLLYKVVIIGESGVGKTNIISRFISNEFSSENKSTIGVEFAHGEVKVEEGLNIKVQIWDTAGQERFRAITRGYYRGAVGALIVFDVTKTHTFQAVEKWLNELREYAEPNIMILLVGNKTDLKPQRQVSTEQAQTLAQQNQLLYIETSALDGSNIHESFKIVVNEIYKLHKKKPNPETRKDPLDHPSGGEKIVLPKDIPQPKPHKEPCSC